MCLGSFCVSPPQKKKNQWEGSTISPDLANRLFCCKFSRDCLHLLHPCHVVVKLVTHCFWANVWWATAASHGLKLCVQESVASWKHPPLTQRRLRRNVENGQRGVFHSLESLFLPSAFPWTLPSSCWPSRWPKSCRENRNKFLARGWRLITTCYKSICSLRPLRLRMTVYQKLQLCLLL